MGTFITDGASVLPDVKTDARPSTGASTEWAATDANEVRSALLDLRTAALAVQSGFVNPNTALVTSSGSPGDTKALQDWMAVVEAGGGGSGTVTSVAGTAPIGVTNGTTTPNVTISEATTSNRGTMSAADKTKLDSLGLMTPTDKTKLDAYPTIIGGTASSSTYLRGDGTWYTPAGGGGGSVTEVTGTSPISVATGTTTPAISLGTVPVSKGGTGATTLTSASVLVGNGTSAVSGVAPGTSGNVLVSNGSAWASGTNAPTWSNVSGKPTVVEAVAGSGVVTSSGTTSITVGLNGISALGTAGQMMIVNSGATALEWKSSSASGGTSNVALRDGSGNIYANDFYATSDERLKTDISQIAGALAKVKSLRGVQFKKISDPAKFRVGLVAQDVLQIVPEAIYESAEEPHYLSVNYGSLVGVLVEAVKELSEKVAALEALNGAP